MANSVVESMIAIIMFSVLVYRINANVHKKNYNKLLEELGECDRWKI